MSHVRVVVRVDLDSEGYDDLIAVRNYLGLKNYSEFIRYLIREKAREIKIEEHVTPVTTEEGLGLGWFCLCG